MRFIVNIDAEADEFADSPDAVAEQIRFHLLDLFPRTREWLEAITVEHVPEDQP